MQDGLRGHLYRFVVRPLLSLLMLFGMGIDLFAADLSETIQAAKRYDAAYLAGVAQYQSVLTRESQSLASLLPRLIASGNATQNAAETSYGNTSQPDVSRNYTSGGYTVQLTQPLFQMGAIHSYVQSKYLVAQAEAQRTQAENDLILRVAQAYYDVLLAIDRLEHIRAQKKSIYEQLAAASKSYKVGAGGITDVEESKAKFELVTAQAIEAEAEVENKRQALAMVAGPDIGDPRSVRSNPAFPAGVVDDWILKVDGNPSVAAAKAAIDVAEKEISKARSGHYPNLNLVASYSDTLQGPDSNSSLSTDIRTNNKAVGLQLQIPIFEGGGTQAKVDEATRLREKARNEYQNVRRQVILQLNQAFLGIVTGLAQIKALEAGVVSSEMALKSNTKGYKVGIRTNADVLNAMQQLFSAKTDLNRARYSTWMQHLKLKLSVGEVWDGK